MIRDREAYEAGIEYGKQYRRSHRSWSTDAAVARRAADSLGSPSDVHPYDYTEFYHGVVRGLRPFAAADFEATFERNAQSVTYKAQAVFNGARLEVATNDAARYEAILAHWREIGAKTHGCSRACPGWPA